MRKVRCYECGKTYDYDTDDFCPKCGAFNQPPKSTTIDANGAVIRVDGINERGHAGSFVHEELHEENRERKRMGLSRVPAGRRLRRHSRLCRDLHPGRAEDKAGKRSLRWAS